jgi:hypothetical protein
LIDKSFDAVIARAQEKNTDALNQLVGEVIALLDAVEGLYRSMDNSLKFPTAAKVPA